MPGGFSSGFSSGFGASPLTRTATGLIFRDQFTRADGAPGANYTIALATWAISGNKLVSTSGAAQGRIQVTGAGNVKNTHVQMSLTKNHLNDFNSPLTRVDAAANNLYIFDVGGATDGTDPNRARIYRGTGGGYTRLAGGYVIPGLAAGVPYRSNFTTLTGDQRYWINGILALTATDATAANDIAGGVGISYIPAAGGNANIAIDDIIICSARTIVVNGLPAGYKIRANGITAVAVAGTATIDLLGTLLPVTSLDVLDAADGLKSSTDIEVWGGDVFTYSTLNAYSAVGTGGVHVAGSAVATHSAGFVAVGTGGVHVAGTAMPALGRAIVGSGGVSVGGTAIVSRGYAHVGTGGVVIGGTAEIATEILNYHQYGDRDYTGTGIVDDGPGLPLIGTVVDRTGATGTVVPQPEGAMGTAKKKPSRPGGGRTVVQHFIFKGRGLITVSGSAQASLIPSDSPQPPTAYAHVASGGVRVGGTGSVSVNIAKHYQGFPHGGVRVSGTAPVLVNNITLPRTFAWHGSGGVRAAGTAPASSTLAQHFARTGTGGVRVSGSAIVTSSLVRRYAQTGSGILIIRGTAPVSRFINTPGSSGAFTTPTPPATFDYSRNPAHFTSEVTATSLADLQNKIDTVPAGTRIRIPLGANWQGTVFLRNRGFGANQWIELAPDMTHAAFEAARAYGRRMTLGIASSLNLPTLRNGSGNSAVIWCDAGAAGYRLTGLNFRLGGDVSAMCRLGYPDMTTAAQACRRIIVDRCTAVGGTTFWTNRAFYCCGEQVAILGTWISDIYGTGDTQGILTGGWQGPYAFRWNHVEGWTMGWMSGGAESTAGGVPSDVVFEDNYVTKNVAYRYAPPFGCTVKNLLEAKSVRRASVKRNIFEYDWKDGQAFPANIKSVNQSKQQPQQGTIDYELAYNWFRKVPSGFNFSADPEGFATPMRRVYVHDNLIEEVNTLPDFLGNGVQMQFLGSLSDMTLDHNTMVKTSVGGVTAFSLEGAAIGPIAVRSNIIRLDGYGLKRSGTAQGVNSWNGYVPNAAHRFWAGNVGINIDPAITYPAGTIRVPNEAAIGYVDLVGGNYQVTGALATAGHDGLPVGIADYPAFKAGLASVQNG